MYFLGLYIQVSIRAIFLLRLPLKQLPCRQPRPLLNVDNTQSNINTTVSLTTLTKHLLRLRPVAPEVKVDNHLVRMLPKSFPHHTDQSYF